MRIMIMAAAGYSPFLPSSTAPEPNPIGEAAEIVTFGRKADASDTALACKLRLLLTYQCEK
ncbi:hypothetical protein KXR53_14255 [Inquilinus limosus]